MNNAPTVKSLRQSGYKVRVLHSRNISTTPKMSGTSQEILSRGGKTTIEVTTPDKLITVSGTAQCSEEDNFSKKIGRNIALGRALAQLPQASMD